jgi:hypothetical protein
MASLFTKTMPALETAPGPAMTALMERANLTREESISVLAFARMVWMLTVQTIANVDELSAIERHEFDGNIRFNYGTNNPNRVVYEAFLKPRAHPDVARYIDSVLAQP